MIQFFSQSILLISLATVGNASLHPLDIFYHSEHIIGLKQLLILLDLPIADLPSAIANTPDCQM